MKAFTLIIISLFSIGCATSITPLSDKENVWITHGEGASADVYYCVSRTDGKLADPSCFKAKMLSPK